MATVTEEIAERVRTAIGRAERSHKWTAEKSGIPLSTFNRKVKGFKDFTPSELIRISDALSVQPADLLPAVFAGDARSTQDVAA